jgi:MFS family permease
MAKNRKAWAVLAVLCGLAAAAIGISINTSGVFYSVVAEDLGILRGSFSLHMTIFSMVTAISALFAPKLLEKLPFKKLLISAVLIAVMGTAAMALSTKLWQFYLLGAVRGFSTGLFSIVTITIIINKWFVEKNGLATSIALGFSGLMGALFSPIFSSLITSIGWQGAYLVEAGLLLLLCLPAIIYPFAINPEREGAQAYGQIKNRKNMTSLSTGKILTLPFIAIISFGILTSFVSSMPQHFPGYAGTIGLSTTVGASLLSMGMIGNIISKLVIGAFSDKIGSIKATFVLLFANTIGAVLLLLGHPSNLMLLAAFLFGSCYGLGAVSVPLVTRTVFGDTNYSKVFPVVSFAGNVGAAVAFSAIGYIYDFTGTYLPAIILILVMLLICYLALFVANRYAIDNN